MAAAEKKIVLVDIEDLFDRASSAASLMLNAGGTKSSSNRRFLANIWNSSKVRVAVDGGANLCFDGSVGSTDGLLEPPHIVSGDFDSIRSNVLSHYKSLEGVKVMETADQNHTDFTKALMLLAEEEETSVDFVFALGEMCGRLDQVRAATFCATISLL